MFRELARKKQKIDTKECVHILKTDLRGVLSVLGDEGYPYGMPMTHWYCEEDGCLYFHSGKKGHRIDAMRRMDKASYCVLDKGTKIEGDWALEFKSVIVFGRIEEVTDQERLIEICRRLSYKFTDDESYIENEIKKFGTGTLVFALRPESITGKRVTES